MDAAVDEDDPPMPHEAGMDAAVTSSDGGSSVGKDGGSGPGDGSTGFASRECDHADECDDRNACTLDECFNGMCSHSIDADACDTGQACDPREGGCVDTAICGEDGDCEDGDPCTRNETCNLSASRCEWSILDNDDDGHAAEACGGDDFDDGSGTDYPGAPDVCDGLDNDRDGTADEEPDASGSCPAEHGDSVTCREGECELICEGQYADCDGEYDNGCEAYLPSSLQHCGTCGYSCNSCDGGECGPGACIDPVDYDGDDWYFQRLRAIDCHVTGTCFSDIVAECTADCLQEDQACIGLCTNELLPVGSEDLTDGCMDCALELSACQRNCAEASGTTLQQCACEPDCVEIFETCAGQDMLFECD